MGKRRNSNVATPRNMGVSHAIKKPKKSAKKSIKKLDFKSEAGSVIVTAGPYEIGMKVDCLWSGDPYSGKVMKTEKGKVLIHFDGWNKKYDEWIKVPANITVLKQEREALAPIGNLLDSPKRGKMNNNDKVKEEVKAELDESEVKTEEEEEDFEDDFDDISDYERLRLKNIKEREAMMRDIAEVKVRVSEAFSPAVSKEKSAASKRGLTSVKKEKEILPPRKSARLAGGKVPEIVRYIPELAPEPEDTLLPLETLPLKDTFKYGEEEEKLKVAEQFIETYVKSTSKTMQSSPGNSEEYLNRMKKLTITEERVAKVVPDRIFSIAVHPSSHKLLVSAGAKWGAVGLWDVADTQSKEHGVYLFTAHSRPVNCMNWDRFNSNRLITTSYDGTSRIFDLEKMEHRLLYGDEKFLDHGGYSAAHSQIDANTFLVSKGKQGIVGLVDIRAGHESTIQDYHVFDRVSAKCIDTHPVKNNVFLAANNRAGCFVFDVRNKGSKSLMTPICELAGHTKSISSALFSPITGNKVMTIAYDDKLRLFDTSNLKGDIRGKETRHNNQTGRWLTPFKGHWHPTRDDILFTGCMDRPRKLEVWTAGSSLQRAHCFHGEDFSSICSVVAVHPSNDVLVGGNSSGRVFAFM